MLKGKSPFHVVFGQLLCVGISNLPLTQDLLENLYTEGELNAALGITETETVDEEDNNEDKNNDKRVMRNFHHSGRFLLLQFLPKVQ